MQEAAEAVAKRKDTSDPLAKLAGKPWDRQSFENDLWHGRFLHYLKLGPRRSVSLASTGKRNAYPVPSHWMIIAKDHLWRERAHAYDEAHGLLESEPAD